MSNKEELAWLLDINQPLDLSGPGWRDKQKQVLELPKWFYEPSEVVRDYLLEEPDEHGRPPHIDEEDLEEVQEHLAKDPVAFVHFCGWFMDRDNRKWKRGRLTPGQLVILWRFAVLWLGDKKIRLALLKQRRGGFSWLIDGGLMSWVHFFHPNRGGISMAQDRQTAQGLLEYLRTTFNRLPPDMKPTKAYNTRNDITLKETNEARIDEGDFGLMSSVYVSSIGTRYVGTGQDVQAVHMSEVGKYEGLGSDPDVVYASLTNTIPEVGRTIIFLESTAHGAKTWWKEMWDEAMKMGGSGWNGFTPIFIPWYFDPRNVDEPPREVHWGTSEDHEFGNEEEERERYGLTDQQLWWRRVFITKQKSSGHTSKVDIFRQEFPGNPVEAWLFAGGLFINRKLAKIIWSHALGPETHRPLWRGFVWHRRGEKDKKEQFSAWSKPDRLGPFQVWRWPLAGRAYLVGADLSSGQAEDQSCMKVYEWSPHKIWLAAEWLGYISPPDFAHLLWRVGHFYNTAVLAWERVGPGLGVAEHLRKGVAADNEPYPAAAMYRRPRTNNVSWTPDSEYGINTTGATKRPMLDLWVNAAMEGRIELLQHDVREALDLTIEDNGKVETKGRDRFMASVMANMCYFTYQGRFQTEHGPVRQAHPHSVDWADSLIQEGQRRRASGSGTRSNVLFRGGG